MKRAKNTQVKTTDLTRNTPVLVPEQLRYTRAGGMPLGSPPDKEPVDPGCVVLNYPPDKEPVDPG